MKEATAEHLNLILRNAGVTVAVAYAVWVTRSPWPLLGLLFLAGWKHVYGVCPDCKRKVELKHEDELEG